MGAPGDVVEHLQYLKERTERGLLLSVDEVRFLFTEIADGARCWRALAIHGNHRASEEAADAVLEALGERP